MIGSKKDKEAGRAVFMSSVFGLSNIMAVIATFLATPFVFDLSIDWIEAFTGAHYGWEAAKWVGVPWAVVIAITVFFMSRATVGVAITLGGLAIAARLL